MSNRFGREHRRLPHCLRQLPENQPRNRQEYILRKALNPEDADMYFDNTGRFLYDNKCMSQELERIKMSRTRSLSIVSNHAQFLKRLILGEETKPYVDINSMRARYRIAQAGTSQSLVSADQSKSENRRSRKVKRRNASATVRSPRSLSSPSCSSRTLSPSNDTK